MASKLVAVLSGANPGARRGGLLLVSAVLCGLAQPFAWPAPPAHELGPRGLFALLALVGPAFLIAAVRGLSPGRAYWLGFLGFFCQLALVFYWLYIPIVVFGGLPPIVGVAGWLAVAAILAPVLAAAPALAVYLERRARVPAAIAWPLAWTAVELLRNMFPFGGFPWGSIGAGLAGNQVVLQLASLFGVYGLTFLSVAVAALLADAAQAWRSRRSSPWRTIAGLGFGAALVLAFGLWRIEWLAQVEARAPSLRVAVLQGNIEQGIKNKAKQYKGDILAKYQRLAKQAVEQGAQLLVWPESAYPNFTERSARTFAGRGFGEMTPGVFTAAGLVFYWRDQQDMKQVNLHNSMVVLDPEHTVMGAFHKRHLVPFGEAVPWPLDSFFKRLVPGLGMFKPGPEAEPIKVLGARLAGLICYEGIFPQYSRRFVRAGANLLVNVTNDAWYGYSSAPHQHVGYYALRAVENGRSVVRAANAGVSALYGADGRPRGATRLFEDAVLVESAPLLEIRTLYQLVGDVPAWLCLAILLGLVGARLVRREDDPTRG